jgi:hypothetical protein
MLAAAVHRRSAAPNGAGGRFVATAALNAAAGVARCKKQSRGAGGAAPTSCVGLPGDDRAVPTGANPLHNR